MATMHVAVCLALALMLLVPDHAARALRFAYYPALTAEGAGLLAASGPVKLGDEDRLRAALHALPAGARLAGLSLDSPGGDLEEGFRLAAAVRAGGLATVVGEGATCASACFLVFAAGSHRFASTTALVGVHSAAYGGGDTADAQVATVRMARRLAEYGVPNAILGKMVSAQPSQIWWLNRQDFESMRVDLHAPQVAALPVVLDEPHSAEPPTRLSARSKPGGFQVAPAANGFHVWRPGITE